MSIRIQVASEATTPTRYTNKRTGMPDKEQTAWAFLTERDGNPSPHPTKITLVVEQPYPVGDYTLHPSAFYVGEWGKLQVVPRLAPLKAKA